MNQTLKTLFENRYSSTAWKSLLRSLFKDKETAFYKTVIDKIDKNKKSHEIVHSIEEFGDLKLSDNSRILFYEVALKSGKQINSRVALRKIIHSDVIPGDVDGIIATYYYQDSDDWRLTFISKSLYWDEEYNQIKEETHPKRYTYVLGKGESIKTALGQFEWLSQEVSNKDISIKDIIKAFSVEKISNVFFKQYFHHFESFEAFITDNPKAFRHFKSLTSKNKPNKEQQEEAEKLVRHFVKKMMGRIVFLYFLQKKGWLGVPNDQEWGYGKKDFISDLFKNFPDKKDFYRDCLVPLFFDTLNKDRKKTNDIFAITNTRIPYLNGGLFGRDNIEPIDIKIPPYYFEDLFDFFDQYNFTIDENSPDDQDIGIDPEMLGLIFENLLEDNKDKGTFYTPKEVVHFMCKESISQYVLDYLKNTADQRELKEISDYIKNSNPKIDLEVIKRYAERIDISLSECKICDPAIGSGAFPMGMVFEILRLKKELHGFYKNEDFIYRTEKLNIIKNNIYGVDLDQGAVDIARLRFWLSLIVDEKQPKPLPNLDYKIMQGNSLIEWFEDIPLDKITNETVSVFGPPKQMTLGEEFDAPQKEIEFTVEEKIELKSWVDDYFSVDNAKEKEALHAKIDRAVINHLDKNTELYEKSASRQIAEIEDKYSKAGKNIAKLKSGNDYKKWHSLKTKSETTRNKLKQIEETIERPYFLWHLYFGKVLNEGKKGFDIVIGNPPYGGTKIDDKVQNEFALQSKDPYGAFMSMAINKLLKPDGILCYIVSDTWLTIKSHRALREQVLKYQLKNVIRLHQDCFKATVNSCIVTVKKAESSGSEEVLAADLTNISTRKQIPEFRDKLFHLKELSGKYTSEFAVYAYVQDTLKTNSNFPIIVGSPKLFKLMQDKNSNVIQRELNDTKIPVRQIIFNGKIIELVKFGDVADVKVGLQTGDNKSYLYQNASARGNYRDINLYKKYLLTEDELAFIRANEDVRLKVIEYGIHKDEFEKGFDKNRYFGGRYIIPHDKGGESDVESGWLPNYFVETNYYIDWSTDAISNIKSVKGENGKLKSRFQNINFYFKKGIDYSQTGIYCPTFRINSAAVFNTEATSIFSDHDVETLLGILSSKLTRYLIKVSIDHTVHASADKLKETSILYSIENADIKKNVASIIKKQKQDPRYNYFANEQKIIDKIVYEQYGLNEDDVNEVETWFARRYPKLSNYAYYVSQEELLQKQLLQSDSNNKILELIESGESKTVEFKSTLRYGLRQMAPDKGVEHTAMKNLAAFLNTEGGTLFIGVDDDGNILGLEETDFASFKGSNKKDEFNKHFDTLVQNYFGNDFTHKFKVEFEVIEEKTIALINIQTRASNPVIIKNPEKNIEEFYVRRNASSIALTMYEMINYVNENWVSKK